MSTPTPANCSGLANSGVPAKAPGIEIAASAGRVSRGLASPRSMILAVTVLSSFDTHHDIAWFDIPVDELLLVNCSQTGGDLGRDFQRQLYLDRPERLMRFASVSPSTNSIA